ASSPIRTDEARPVIDPALLADRPQRVLVVDDHEDGAAMIGELLAEAGHDVRVAHDASQALSVADDFRPQTAILDIGLPVMDGYSLGRELRTRLGGAAPTLIALTGYGQDRDKRRGEEAGFSAHLVKPVDVDELLRSIDELGAKPLQ